MSFKKLGIALAAFAALGAVLASSAVAGTPVTEAAAWTKTVGGETKTIAEEGITCRHTAGEENFVFKSKVLGQNLKMTGTGISCTGAKVVTTGSGATSMAGAEGVIEFSSITVNEPAGCVAPNVKTNTLVADLQMDSVNKNNGYVKFTPKTGTTFANIKLEKCAAAGTYPVNGVVYGQATSPTNEHKVNQQVAGNETTHAMSSLTLGKEAATLTGEFEVELASGAAWGAEHP